MTLDDRLALQIGRAAVMVAKLETQLEEARARIAELEAAAKPAAKPSAVPQAR